MCLKGKIWSQLTNDLGGLQRSLQLVRSYQHAGHSYLSADGCFMHNNRGHILFNREDIREMYHNQYIEYTRPALIPTKHEEVIQVIFHGFSINKIRCCRRNVEVDKTQRNNNLYNIIIILSVDNYISELKWRNDKFYSTDITFPVNFLSKCFIFRSTAVLSPLEKQKHIFEHTNILQGLHKTLVTNNINVSITVWQLDSMHHTSTL